jgi:hypothetical protein
MVLLLSSGAVIVEAGKVFRRRVEELYPVIKREEDH